MSYNSREVIEEDIIAIYEYGSKVYGTATSHSDDDYIYVVEGEDEFDYNITGVADTDIIVYSKALFIKKIKEHHISILECIFQKDDDPFQQYFEYDSSKLRHAISSVASNSFCKGKKKFKDGEYYIGKKSLFHSLRILIFGIQIAVCRKIVNYEHANTYHNQIMDMDSLDWNDYKGKYQSDYNLYKSILKVVAPMEGE